jgi:hypothetical protein
MTTYVLYLAYTIPRYANLEDNLQGASVKLECKDCEQIKLRISMEREIKN